MTSGRIELLVEPFTESDPGPHVLAVLAELEAAGLSFDMGPFSTTAVGDLDALAGVVERLLRAGFEAGASSIQARVERLPTEP